MVKKFITINRDLESITLADFLEILDSVTCFDPKRSTAAVGEKLLWDYKKSWQAGGISTLSELSKEDIGLLKKKIWTDIGMPMRFIPFKEWDAYQEVFERSPEKPKWQLEPIFFSNAGVKIKTVGRHYFRLKKMVEECLPKTMTSIYSDQKSKPFMGNFYAGLLLSVALIANPYLDSDIDFLGELPAQEETKRSKLTNQDNELEKILMYLGVDKLDIPVTYAGNRYSIKLLAWKKARADEKIFPTKVAFDHTWRRLRRNGRIQYSDEVAGDIQKRMPSSPPPT